MSEHHHEGHFIAGDSLCTPALLVVHGVGLNAHTYSCWEHADFYLLEGFPRHLADSHAPALPRHWAAELAGAEMTAFWTNPPDSMQQESRTQRVLRLHSCWWSQAPALFIQELIILDSESLCWAYIKVTQHIQMSHLKGYPWEYQHGKDCICMGCI